MGNSGKTAVLIYVLNRGVFMGRELRGLQPPQKFRKYKVMSYKI